MITCEQITKISESIQNKLIREFAKVDTATKLQVTYERPKIFHKLKNLHGNIDNKVIELSSFVLAIKKVLGNFDTVNFNAVKLNAKHAKASLKREKLLGYWAIVRTLKLEHKMSFRDIATYFAKYHKLEVSYSTIFSMWNELENNKTQIKEN